MIKLGVSFYVENKWLQIVKKGKIFKALYKKSKILHIVLGQVFWKCIEDEYVLIDDLGPFLINLIYP